MKKNSAKISEENQWPAWRIMKLLEERLGHEFTNHHLLELALTHSSWANDQQQPNKNNERLEFLGDAVLELCISQELYRRYPNAREGALTNMRSQLVNETILANLGRNIGIDKAIRLGNGEELQNGRNKNSLIADAFEAVIAAIFLDCGFGITQTVINHLFCEMWPTISQKVQEKDPKTLLQEVCHKKFGQFPVYKTTGSNGPAHEKIFSIVLQLPDGKEYIGEGRSQKKAEQAAASGALKQISND